MAIYNSILEEGKIPLIIDAGANTGYSAIWFNLNFPKAQIFAVEPDGSNFSLMKQNVSMFANIIPIEAALWNEKATVSVLDPTDLAWGRRFDVAADGPGIPSVTVAELIARDSRYAPLLIKIDIEGAETQLLRSNTEWVDQFPLVVFEPHDTLFHWLGSWKGSGHSFFSNLARRPREYLPKGENIFAFLHPQM
jgi:FkbM family methyltransferase